MSQPVLQLRFIGNLKGLLCKDKATGIVHYPLTRRASIKDIIEALGVPHTEVGKITFDRDESGFDYLPETSTIVEISPFTNEISITTPTRLRPAPFSDYRFLVDINVRKLGRNLRILGFDAADIIGSDLVAIAEQANEEQRIMLSRNRELLKIRTIQYGQLLRSENHQEQLIEVVDRYGLQTQIKPFSRCLSCNAKLRLIDKKDVLHLLEPLTKKYYSTFKQCEQCKKVYWRGSHHEKMMQLIDAIDIAITDL